jgi:hypothetical protein
VLLFIVSRGVLHFNSCCSLRFICYLYDALLTPLPPLPAVLQFHFNEVIFSEETAMYAAEGVPTESVVFEDNAECVKLIEGGTLCAAAVSCVVCGVCLCGVVGRWVASCVQT